VLPEHVKMMCKKARFYVSVKLPMIVKPKKYKYILEDGIIKTTHLGGYLTNDIDITQELIISKSTISKDYYMSNQIIYDLVNNLSSVPYKINKQVYNFIIDKDHEFNLIMKESEIENDCINSEGKFKSKYKESKYKSEMSKFILESTILDIAYLFENVNEFFFPVRLDQRGRVYCTPNHLNYQSTELSKSLLLFSNPTEIYRNDKQAFEYLFIYGANCFGNGLDKKSNDLRVN